MKIKSILFPVDFSDRCAAVVPHVRLRPGDSVSVVLLRVVRLW